jgi:hypothetical protein
MPNRPGTIGVAEWLARHDDSAAAWLREQTADLAADPQLADLARVGRIHAHHDRVVDLLQQAITTGWQGHGPAGHHLFARYTHDEPFRGDLHTVVGFGAYTTARGTENSPAIDARRQRQLVKAIEDHASRYAAAGLGPARYIAEAHIPGGATSSEWEWIAYYIAAHPDVLHRPVMTPQDIDSRDRTHADELDRQAHQAFTDGDYQWALDLIDEAELYQPTRDWNLVRDYIRPHLPDSLGSAGAGPTAGTAFQQPPPAAATAAAPQPPTVEAPTTPASRGPHR